MRKNKAFFDKAIALAAAGADLYQRGWVPATSGNFSLRLDDDSALLTASGKHKGQLAPTDFIAVDLDGQPLSDGKPSAETLLHTSLYRRFPNLGAVLHCHSPDATLISRLHAQSGYIALRDYELLKAFPGIDSHDCAVNIPIFANTQDIAALAIEVDEYLAERPDCPGYLIQGHGLYCWGNTLEDCMRNLEALEFMLHCELEMQRLKR
ncbi:MAG: methylthioribulose 1-phosphate dehydratase [Spongiibacter sp.]|jgi:methylthioribulose-1-phosphate dehydratase|uniref:methylthioribulose 1-phosphate dehydratase n=1 Tax=Spongiibacter sp. TaxID=2024860 RepID=UPI0003B6DBC7|nr:MULTISPECIES: methylthioribulose 1-phosphate dehydratase [Spongiibacter]MAY39546.1 methylthioribulose 1-phosphate dehydratase [Spongiibacter sp.]MBI58572.1 methylthioribulose 1-phosphate dehydratase [Spongiibacter sp.]MBO6753955.1 methylthioribulose 1-phosphate dehydratase [Spongiibacter sp.]|tara:strand:+ start:19991 stop:20614 length:624 start_codon:yes stop_codon:yes gene_type:complete